MKTITRYQAVRADERGPVYDCELVCRHCTPLDAGWEIQRVQLIEFSAIDSEGELVCLIAFDGQNPREVLIHRGDWRAVEPSSATRSEICALAILLRNRRTFWQRAKAIFRRSTSSVETAAYWWQKEAL